MRPRKKQLILAETELGRRVVEEFARGASVHAIAMASGRTVLTVERLIRRALRGAEPEEQRG